MKKKLIAFLFVGLMVTTALAVLPTMAAAEKKFEGQNLDWPLFAGWSFLEPIFAREAEFTEMTGATWTHHAIPHVDLYAKLLSELVARTKAYDMIPGGSYPGLFKNYWMPLDKFIERDFGSIENFSKRFFPSTWEAGIYDGKVKAIPYNVACQFFGYRKDLFENPAEKAAFKAKYGYELQVPQTDQQIIDIAQFFTRPDEDMWGIAWMGKSAPGGWCMIYKLYSAGLRIVDVETGKVPFRSGVAKQKAIEAAQFWYDLVHKYKAAPPNVNDIGHTDLKELYIGGHTAMAFGWVGDWYAELLKPEIIADIGETGSFLLSITEPNGVIFAPVQVMGIPKDSKQPDLAWEWIKWMTSKDMMLTITKESGNPTANEPAMMEALELGLSPKALVDGILEGLPKPRIPQIYPICDLYWRYAPAMYAGELTPEEFIDLVIEKTEEAME